MQIFSTVSRPQSSEGDPPQTNQSQNGIPASSASTEFVANRRKGFDGSSISDAGSLLLDPLAIDLTPSELSQLSNGSADLMNRINEKNITSKNLNSGKATLNPHSTFQPQNVQIDTNGFGPRGSLV